MNTAGLSHDFSTFYLTRKPRTQHAQLAGPWWRLHSALLGITNKEWPMRGL